MIKVAFFGELLLRLDTPDYQRFVQADSLQVSYTGGEANVGVDLAQWGVESSMISAVPDNPLGEACINHLRRYGVKTEEVIRSGSRLGVLYVEKGAGQRGTQVTYDRSNTSFRELQPADINWQRALSNQAWLHFTGTALVSPTTRATLLAGLKVAKEMNVLVSFDVSYRSKLWGVEEATNVFSEVMDNVDLLIGSERDAQTFFGVNETGDAALTALHEKYDLKWTAFTDRRIDSQGTNFYSAKMFDGNSLLESEELPTVSVDRIGTGDAFVAGLIYCLLNNVPDEEILQFATAAAVLKHTIPGDFALLTLAEIQAFLDGSSTGKISR